MNQEAVWATPLKALQLCRTLEHILCKVVSGDPSVGPVYLLNLDLADGFYSVPLHNNDIPLLGVTLPMAPGMVHFLRSSHGWIDSLPYFCTTIETIMDLTNTLAHSPWKPLAIPLEQVILTFQCHVQPSP